MSELEQHDRPSAAMSIARSSDARMRAARDVGPSTSGTVLARDPVDAVACRMGDSSCASAHAGVLHRSKRLDGTGAQRSLLKLQMRYGNQYVGRVLSRVSSGGDPSTDMAGIERTIDTARGSGHGMDHSTRTRMETAFGADFSGVRIHTDARSDGLNRSLSARAFTTGHDVFFRQGEYSPGTSSGRELLAHELTHVVQQTGDGIQRKMSVSQPGDPHEVEADQMAHAVIQQEHAPSVEPQTVARAQEEDKDKQMVARRATDALQRQPEAPKPQDEEEKKKLHAKLDRATVSREREDEPAE